MSQTIALTGATGFIGTVLAQRLKGATWQIRALARPTSERAHLAGTVTQWVEGGLEDLDSLRRLVDGVYGVIHCAGAVRGASQEDFNRVNVDGVGRLVQAANEQQPVPRFLLISSLAAREPQLSPYAASKRGGEETLAKMAGDMVWAALRPPAVYGPGDRELLPLFRWMARGIAPVLGPKSGRFSLLYAEDLAEAVITWLNHEYCERRAYELHDGHPEGYSWSEVLDTFTRLRAKRVLRIQVPVFFLQSLAALNVALARVIGYAPMLTPGKVRELNHPNWICDNGQLNRETGWTPRVSLEEGLKRTLSWTSG